MFVVLEGNISQIVSLFASLDKYTITLTFSYMIDLMNAICRMPLEMGLMTKAGPSKDLVETDTLST